MRSSSTSTFRFSRSLWIRCRSSRRSGAERPSSRTPPGTGRRRSVTWPVAPATRGGSAPVGRRRRRGALRARSDAGRRRRDATRRTQTCRRCRRADGVERAHDRREQGTHLRLIDALEHLAEATFRDGVEAGPGRTDLDDRWDRREPARRGARRLVLAKRVLQGAEPDDEISVPEAVRERLDHSPPARIVTPLTSGPKRSPRNAAAASRSSRPGGTMPMAATIDRGRSVGFDM